MRATHAVAYSKLPDVRIAAISARDEQRLSGDFSKVGGKLGLVPPNLDFSETAKYEDWEQLIADSAVDICLLTSLHERVTLTCSRPLFVLCEDRE
jgi:predicted dehydrogenase